MAENVLACGDRHWTEYKIIFGTIASLGKVDKIIVGDADGADELIKKAARELDIPFVEFIAEWEIYGKAAGPIRNRRMIEEGKPTRVVAFHNNLEKSRGTADTVAQARARGIPVKIVGRSG